MLEKRSFNPVAARQAVDTGDSSHCLGLVLAGSLGATGLAAVVLLSGGGLLAAALTYTLGASGAVAGLALREAGPSRTLHALTQRRRYDDRLHIPS
jgi:hypothetical protein